MKFVDLFAGIGGFHLALGQLGHECVFASELDEELQALYLRNFPRMNGRVLGDIRKWKDDVPEHDILCAGFPCQPFSKSGGQLGTRDETRGTLFHEIIDVLARRRPRFVLLENVGNFGRHDGGRTWRVVRERLAALGYHVSGTEHKTAAPLTDWRDVGGGAPTGAGRANRLHGLVGGGSGLISPHHFGYPQHRDRFFIVASLAPLPVPPFPHPEPRAINRLADIVQRPRDLSSQDRTETRLSPQQRLCISHWDRLVQALPDSIELPSFPLWGDELGATYPFDDRTPWATPPAALGKCFRPSFPKYTRKEAMMARLPSYAREERAAFRQWKIRFIRNNRAWWSHAAPHLPPGWESTLQTFPSSLRKLEWNAKGQRGSVWDYVLQFRPSGLRVKRYTSSPALVAMTATQIPLLGPEGRFLTRTEGLRLQGFPDHHHLPASRALAFRALGNAVHVRVVERLLLHLLTSDSGTPRHRHTDAMPAAISQRLHAATQETIHG